MKEPVPLRGGISKAMDTNRAHSLIFWGVRATDYYRLVPRHLPGLQNHDFHHFKYTTRLTNHVSGSNFRYLAIHT